MLASINLALFAVVLGIRAFTDEFRHGSIVATLVVAPGRSRVLVAKMVTYAGAGAVLAAIAQAVMVVIAAVALEAKGANASFTGTDAAAVGGLTVAAALWTGIGVAVGGIVRHQVGAIVGALIWVLLLENLGSGFLGDASRYLPGQAGHALAQASQAGTLLAPAAGALLLVAYAVISATAAAARLSRDVSAG